MRRVRRRRVRRARVQVGEPDESLTRFSGLIAVTELVERLGMIERLDAAVGPIKARDRGFTARAGAGRHGRGTAMRGGLPRRAGPAPRRRGGAGVDPSAGAGVDDRRRPGPAGDRSPVGAVETGLGDVHATALDLLDRLDPDRAHALSAEVTIDMDTSDVEVYGRLKRGVAFNHQGQRVGRPVAPRPRRPISPNQPGSRCPLAAGTSGCVGVVACGRIRIDVPTPTGGCVRSMAGVGRLGG